MGLLPGIALSSREVALVAALWVSCTPALAQSQPASIGTRAESKPSSQSERPGLSNPPASHSAPDAAGYVGNEACAGCHAAIYKSYTQTAMARASGPAIENVVPADF